MYMYLGRAEPAPRITGETPGPVRPLALTRVLDTTSEPFHSICRINVLTESGGSSIGTGLLISPYHVLTCAHVLLPLNDPHPKQVTVLPGKNGPDDKRPPIGANGWAVSPGWRWNDCHTVDEDFGIIRLARPAVVGFWPVAQFDVSTITNSTTAHLAGYPTRVGDKKANWMYRSRGRIIGRIQIDNCTQATPQRTGILTRTLWPDIGVNTKLIAHGLDTAPTMSGAPMWTFQEGKRVLFALHAGDFDNGAKKKAILLNPTVRQRISEWMTRTLPPLPAKP